MCLYKLQRVTKRSSYWALNKYIKTDILGKAFKASDANRETFDDSE